MATYDHLGIRGVAEVSCARGGLPAVAVEGPAAGCTGLVYLHGAHVAAWKPAGREEVLWLSEKSLWQADKPIRGGVPLCLPWFGPHKNFPQAPAHGFARLLPWTLESITRETAGVRVTLVLQDDEATRAQWPHAFILRHRVTFGRELTMALELTNPSATEALVAEEAQHTYFSIGDARHARIGGLDGVHYIDKVDAFQEKTQQGDITLTGETDRVYLHTRSAVTIDDPLKRRRITVAKEHSDATVVWNPWIAKAKAMPDFGDEQWPGMVCVETGNVGPHALTVPPGQTHVMTTRISVADSACA